MLRSTQRLTRDQIKEVAQNGDHCHQENVYLKYKTIENNNSLFAVVVPARAVRNAVKRNKVKRQARYVLTKEEDNIKPGIAGVFIFKSGSDKQEFKDLEQQIKDILKRVKILEN